MNWEAVSAVAELLAVIAVIPALLYLVIELRQNTRALQSQTIDSVIDRMSANAPAVVDSDTLPDLMVREWCASERIATRYRRRRKTRHAFLLTMVVRRFEGVHFQRKLGFVRRRDDPRIRALGDLDHLQ